MLTKGEEQIDFYGWQPSIIMSAKSYLMFTVATQTHKNFFDKHKDLMLDYAKKELSREDVWGDNSSLASKFAEQSIKINEQAIEKSKLNVISGDFNRQEPVRYLAELGSDIKDNGPPFKLPQNYFSQDLDSSEFDYHVKQTCYLSARAHYLFTVACGSQDNQVRMREKIMMDFAEKEFATNPELGEKLWERYLQEAQWYAKSSELEFRDSLMDKINENFKCDENKVTKINRTIDNLQGENSIGVPYFMVSLLRRGHEFVHEDDYKVDESHEVSDKSVAELWDFKP